MKNSRLIVVLGMHRSGTSAITRGLQVMGVQLGDRLMPPVEGNNPKGFWEDLDFNALNTEMLKSLGSDWHHLAPIEPGDVEALRKKGYFLRAVELLRQKVGHAASFGFKDPRVAKLLPLWKEVFSHCQLDVSYVLALRHPLSVVKSLSKRDGFDAEKSHLLWLGHVTMSLSGTAGDKRVLVDYDRLIQSPDRELYRIAKHLDLKIDPRELKYYKTAFLDQGLRHTIYNLRDLLLDDTCPPLVREIYVALLDMASDRTRNANLALRKKTARWVREFDRLKSPLTLVDRLSTQKEAANQAVLDRDGQITSLNQAVHDKDVHINNLGQALTERDGQFASLNQTVTERDKQLAVQRDEVQRLQQVVRARDATLAERDGQTASLNQVVVERDGQIASLSQAVTERDWQVTSLNQAVAKRDGRIAHLKEVELHRDALLASTSWRTTKPLRIVGLQLKRAAHVWRLLPRILTIGGGLRTSLIKALRVLRDEGLFGVKQRIEYAATGKPPLLHSPTPSNESSTSNSYDEWIRRYDTLTDGARVKIKRIIENLASKPVISVVMPVYNPKPEWLQEAIESVRQQIYPYWELCIADDASTDPRVKEVLERYVRRDARIKIFVRKKNGHISAATNSALDLVKGEYIALLDHDDILAEHALYWVAEAINRYPEAGLIYSDEDKLDEEGRRHDPYFKCDWNYDLSLSHNLVTHLGVYRISLVRSLGGCREGYEGAQDYDLVLRFIDNLRTDQIIHIPRILYHWRLHKGSTAQDATSKPYAVLAGARAINEHFQRRKISAAVEVLPESHYRVRYALPNPPPLVTLIIPTRNGLALLRQCVSSIFEKTDYPNYELLIVDNGSDDQDVLDFFDQIVADKRIRIRTDHRPFNFSALNNCAVEEAGGELVGLINNDVEVVNRSWLTEMVSIALQPGVGAVGARLWYPDDTLQHGGIILGIGGVAGHSHKRLPRGAHGYFNRANLIQSLSAVTAACMIIQKRVYLEAGGLDEKHLAVAFNDVDFCLKLLGLGYRNVWTPYAELFHHESATRGYEDTPERRLRFSQEVICMKQRWGDIFVKDPAYSPNLTLEREDFSYAWPPRLEHFSDVAVYKP